MRKTNKLLIKKILTAILIVVWMIIVFCFSNQLSKESDKTSQGITKTVLESTKVLENKTIQEQETIIVETDSITRKIAHFVLYIAGGILIFAHVDLYKATTNSKVILSQLVGTLYATSDEIHQVFIPGRSGEIRDVCIDSLGVITGIIVALLILKLAKKKEGIKSGRKKSN